MASKLKLQDQKGTSGRTRIYRCRSLRFQWFGVEVYKFQVSRVRRSECFMFDPRLESELRHNMRVGYEQPE